MYQIFPYITLFSLTLFIRTLATISSRNFIIMWAALELNLLSFIPLILVRKNKQEAEAAVKYFLAQALGSGLFIISFLLISYNPEFMSSPSASRLLLIIGLATKLGIAPTHFWFPSVIANSSWSTCLLLTTWQKIAPLTLIITIITPNNITLNFFGAISALTGGIIGLNQTQLNSLLAYSSIGHLGWTISILSISALQTVLYFIIYATTSIILMLIFNLNNSYSIKQLPSLISSPQKISFILAVLLLSLGGLPPLLGFIPKLIALTSLTSNLQLILTFFLIIGSTLNLSYYLIIIFNLYITSIKPSISPALPVNIFFSSSLVIISSLILIPFFL